ncbi:MAG: hypothetical protein LBJ61_06325 [Deltaproteobacteria bacterium]|jgi:nitrogenase molybdenum-iron protein beta chain|nr:hypothetical protein [Deltaproteobacteria bacterium]
MRAIIDAQLEAPYDNGPDQGLAKTLDVDAPAKECVESPRFSCALGGAIVTLTTLPEVIPIVHAAMGCAGNLIGSISFGGGYLGDGYCGGGHIPTSAITETEIVFGGQKRLEDEIKNALTLIDGKLYVVLTACMTEIIGDDALACVKEFREAGSPVISVSTPSFAGHSYAGHWLALDGIFNGHISQIPQKNPKLVNLFGLVPGYDPFFRGDLDEIARLARGLGLSVNTFFTPDQSFSNLESAPGAALNVLFSPAWGLDFAGRFEKTHGTPYWVTDLPIGAAATDRFLRELGKRLNIRPPKVEKLIASENAVYYGYFLRTVDVFSESDYKFYAATVTDSAYAVPLAYFLAEELGWIVTDSLITEALPDDRKLSVHKAHALTGLGGRLVFETDSTAIAKLIAGYQSNRGHGPQPTGDPRSSQGRPAPDPLFEDRVPFFVLGSTLEKTPALAAKAKHLSLSYPLYDRLVVNAGYAGYRGGLRLLEDLVTSLVSPKA